MQSQKVFCIHTTVLDVRMTPAAGGLSGNQYCALLERASRPRARNLPTRLPLAELATASAQLPEKGGGKAALDAHVSRPQTGVDYQVMTDRPLLEGSASHVYCGRCTASTMAASGYTDVPRFAMQKSLVGVGSHIILDMTFMKCLC